MENLKHSNDEIASNGQVALETQLTSSDGSNQHGQDETPPFDNPIDKESVESDATIKAASIGDGNVDGIQMNTNSERQQPKVTFSNKLN